MVICFEKTVKNICLVLPFSIVATLVMVHLYILMQRSLVAFNIGSIWLPWFVFAAVAPPLIGSVLARLICRFLKMYPIGKQKADEYLKKNKILDDLKDGLIAFVVTAVIFFPILHFLECCINVSGLSSRSVANILGEIVLFPILFCFIFAVIVSINFQTKKQDKLNFIGEPVDQPSVHKGRLQLVIIGSVTSLLLIEYQVVEKLFGRSFSDPSFVLLFIDISCWLAMGLTIINPRRLGISMLIYILYFVVPSSLTLTLPFVLIGAAVRSNIVN